MAENNNKRTDMIGFQHPNKNNLQPEQQPKQSRSLPAPGASSQLYR